jgi:hypothetical protein
MPNTFLSFGDFFRKALDRNKSLRDARDFAIVQYITQAYVNYNFVLDADAEATLVIDTEEEFEYLFTKRPTHEEVCRGTQAFVNVSIQQKKERQLYERSNGSRGFADSGFVDTEDALPSGGRGSRYGEDIRDSQAYRHPFCGQTTPRGQCDEHWCGPASGARAYSDKPPPSGSYRTEKRRCRSPPSRQSHGNQTSSRRGCTEDRYHSSHRSRSRSQSQFENHNRPLICPYKLLGVERSATLDEIREAYKKLSMIYHPDRPVNLANNKKGKEAKGKFQEICNAAEVLSDPEGRAYYDETGNMPRTEAARNQAKRNESRS